MKIKNVIKLLTKGDKRITLESEIWFHDEIQGVRRLKKEDFAVIDAHDAKRNASGDHDLLMLLTGLGDNRMIEKKIS